jgi:hypothetical protein
VVGGGGGKLSKPADRCDFEGGGTRYCVGYKSSFARVLHRAVLTPTVEECTITNHEHSQSKPIFFKSQSKPDVKYDDCRQEFGLFGANHVFWTTPNRPKKLRQNLILKQPSSSS